VSIFNIHGDDDDDTDEDVNEDDNDEEDDVNNRFCDGFLGDFFGCSSLDLSNENVVHGDSAKARRACVVAHIDRQTLGLISDIFPAFCDLILRRFDKNMQHIRRKSSGSAPTSVLVPSISNMQHRRAINPDSNFAIFWETLLFFAITYQVIGVPFYIAFGFENPAVGFSDGISICMEICFCIDMVLKTRTGYMHYGNKVRTTITVTRYIYIYR
jgi:hypothetical protein